MTDFAASAMIRLVRLAATRHGLAMPEPPPRGARYPLMEKRALLGRMLADNGPEALLEIGQAVDDAPDEPVHTALRMATDPLDLLARWRRLEQFIHSRHRTIVRFRSDRHILLEHIAVPPHPAPTDAENLVVFGLLVALLDRLPSGAARVRFAGQGTWRRHRGAWPRGVPRQTASLEVQWTDASPRPPIGRREGDDAVALARRALAEDPGRLWRLGALAERLGVPPRTLQRQLAAGGTTFSSLLSDVRLATAARMLASTTQPLAAIGYACGFSDQAHLTRELRRSAALTPRAYRRLFGAATEPGGARE
jgi:AraC-like DNA-binding protein